jgi:hypothetical protein
MCYVNGSTLASDLSISPIRALHSLTSEQASSVAAALSRQPIAWMADEQEGYDGDLTLVLTPSDPHADLSFALWRSPAGFHLATLRDDEQVSSEIFASLDQVIAELVMSASRLQHSA